MTSQLSPAEIRKLGYEEYSKNNYDVALKYFNELIMNGNISVSDLNVIGGIYFKKENYETALNIFRDLIITSPDFTQPRINLAETLKILAINEKDPKKQLRYMRDALSYNPLNYDIILAVAVFYTKLNKGLRAMEYLHFGVNISPNRIECHIVLAELDIIYRRFEDAEREIMIIRNIDAKQPKLQQLIEMKQQYKMKYNIGNDNVVLNTGLYLSLQNEIQCICEHLYIGSKGGARDLEILKNNKIDIILNVTPNIPNYFENSKNIAIKYYRIGIVDNDTSEIGMNGYLYQCLNIIDECITQGKNILVHCESGVSCSGIVIVAYLMKTNQISYDEALSQAKEKRKCINPYETFIEQTKRYFELMR